MNKTYHYQANTFSSLQSDYSSSGSDQITKVPISAAVKRLHEREERKKAKQS